MKKIIILLVITFVGINASAQTKKNKKEKQKIEVQKAEVITEIRDSKAMPEYETSGAADVQEISVYESRDVTDSGNSSFGDYNYNDIGSGYSIVSLRNGNSDNSKIGIAKDRKLLLPLIFGYYYDRVKPDCIILNIDNQYGVYNAVTQKWILPLLYKSISKLNDNYLAVNKGNKYALFTNLGELIEDFKWDYVNTTSLPNYIQITNNDKKGLYNLANKKITIPCIYNSFDYCEPCGNLFIVNLNEKFNLIDVNNNLQLKNWYDVLSRPNYEIPNFIVKKDGKSGIINYKDEVILPINYQSIEASMFTDGSLIAKNSEGKFGCISIHGKVTLPFDYDKIEINYNENNKRIFSKKDKCGILQMNQGTPFEIATCEYDDIVTYKNFFIAKKNNKKIMLNNFNKPMNEYEFDSLEMLNKIDYYNNNNTVFLGKINNNCYLINSAGVTLNTNPYKSIEKVLVIDVNNDYYEKAENLIFKAINQKNTIDLIDSSGNIIETESVFDDVVSIYSNKIVFKKNKKIGVFNISNKKVIINAEYDAISPTKEGYLAVLNNNYYLINYYDNSKKVLLGK